MRVVRLSVVIAIAALLATGCSSNSGTPAAAPTTTAAVTPTTTAAISGSSASCSYPADGTAAKPAPSPPAAEPNTGTVTAALSLPGGTVTVSMNRSATPCTIGSFVSLAKAGYFNGTPCHRLTTGGGLKVLQCGDPSGSGSGGPGYRFADETTPTMTYPAGTVAMANSGPDTNGSQFFLVYADSSLSPDYTVFGHITAGLDVLTKIAAGGVAGGVSDGPPATPVTISTVTVGS